jgi:hypothetical protein
MKIIMIIGVTVFMIGCAGSNNVNSKTPMRDKYGTISVSPTAKKALKNELANDPENRVICNRVKKTGSNISVVTCKTVAEYKEDIKRSHDAIDRMRSDTNRNMSFDSENPGKYKAAGFTRF